MRSFLVPLSLGIAACNFTEFDTLGADTPVTAYVTKAYGARVALVGDATGIAVLFAGGVPGEGARFYSVGDGLAAPATAPRNNAALCELSGDKLIAGTPCIGGTTLAAVGSLVYPAGRDHLGCAVVGYGRVTTDATNYGPVMVCADGQTFTLSGAPGSKIDEGLKLLNPTTIAAVRVSFAALPGSTGNNAHIVMGSEADGAAWYWPAANAGDSPRTVPAPTDAKAGRFGAATAIGHAGAMPMVLVAAPDNGRVHAYIAGTDGELSPLACLGGDKGLGTALVVGDVDKDGMDDVVATMGNAIVLFLGKNRPTTPGTGDCPAAWPPEPTRLLCADFFGGGCDGAQFGASLAIGDLDGNGTMEVAVGAPGASYQGVPGAGAVFLFTPSVSPLVADVRGLSQPATGDAFGAAVSIAKVGTQDTLAVGARGKGAAYVTWCTRLPGTPSTPRCRK